MQNSKLVPPNRKLGHISEIPEEKFKPTGYIFSLLLYAKKLNRKSDTPYKMLGLISATVHPRRYLVIIHTPDMAQKAKQEVGSVKQEVGSVKQEVVLYLRNAAS